MDACHVLSDEWRLLVDRNRLGARRISVTYDDGNPINDYRQAFGMSRTKSQNLNVSRLVLKLSLPNPLKPCREWRCSWSSADNAPSICEWSTISLPTNIGLILQAWWYFKGILFCRMQFSNLQEHIDGFSITLRTFILMCIQARYWLR